VKYTGEHIMLETTKLSTLPDTPPPIYAAIADPRMGKHTGRLCDGVVTVGAADEKLKMLLENFEEGTRQKDKDPSTMPRILQLHVSWAESQEEAEEQALREWPSGGMSYPKAAPGTPRARTGC
jgi:coenzyme F420-dependent glucose-6-phosphate dehydrogenase